MEIKILKVGDVTSHKQKLNLELRDNYFRGFMQGSSFYGHSDVTVIVAISKEEIKELYNLIK